MALVGEKWSNPKDDRQAMNGFKMKDDESINLLKSNGL
jgi:hypothetical protein